MIVDIYDKECLNKNCNDKNYGYFKNVNALFKISDHTSTLPSVKMTTSLFEKIIGFTVNMKIIFYF